MSTPNPLPVQRHPRPDRHPLQINTEVGQPVPELSVFMLPGRITDPTAGLRETADAERAGFGRVWLSERYDLKDIGLLYAAAATTSRIQLGTGLVAAGAHHPVRLAAFATTMQATFGPRLTIGLGRGVAPAVGPFGFPVLTLEEIEEYAGLLRRLWAGETVASDSRAGGFPGAALLDLVEEFPPPLMLGCLGGPQACAVAARSFDAVFLMPFTTPEAVSETRQLLRSGAEQAGRDPAAVRVIAEVVTAPNLDPDGDEVAALVHARALTYLQMPGLGTPLMKRNRWDPAKLADVLAHPMFAGGKSADQGFHRSQLLEAARMLPNEWILPTAAVGDSAACVRTLRAYLDAGADEITLHGASPAQLAPVVDEFRRTAG